MIEKNLHIIWLGNKDSMPKEVDENIKFFNSEGYNTRLWDEQRLDAEDIMTFAEQSRIINNNEHARFTYAKIADICRYRILSEYGGIYLDADTVVVKSFNELLHKSAFIVGRSKDGLISNGVIIAKQGNYILRQLNIIINSMPQQVLYGNNAWKITGPKLLTKVVEIYEEYSRNITVLPVEAFYPIHHDEAHSGKLDLSKPEKFCTENTYCWTYWNGGTQKKK